MTEATTKIALPMLLDAAKVGERNGTPLFEEADVLHLLQNVTVIEPHTPFQVGDVGVTARPSGHVVGAVGLLLEHQPTSFWVWHTADFNTVATPTTDAAYVPPMPVEVDAVVSESTYGTLELPNRKKQTADFVGMVKGVLEQGGRVLVPTFALGRAQDVLLTLTRQLPGTPIYLDGLVRDITQLYAAMPEHLPEGVRNQLANGTNPFFAPGVEVVKDKKQREAIIQSPHSAVILASSGMLSQGVSPQYAKAVLKEPQSAVLIVGYQDAESAGRRLLEGRNEVLLDGEQVPVLCQVERFYLSAHADRLGISNHLSRYPSSRLVLTHGEGAAREALFAMFKKDRQVRRPEVGEWVNFTDNFAYTYKTPQQSQPPNAHLKGPLKVKRFKADVQVRRDGNKLIVELPEGFDPDLAPEGTYRLEASKERIVRWKVTEHVDAAKTPEGST